MATTIAYEKQDVFLPAKWEIEHIGNKLPFEKKLNIVAGNGKGISASPMKSTES